MTAPATTTMLLDSGCFQVGEFHCGAAHPLWDELNDNIGSRPHFVFPQTSVYIAQGSAERVLATPNHVVFYASHQLYRRELHDPRGDVSLFVTVDPPLFAELDGDRRRPLGASDAETYLAVQLVVRHLREERHDSLFVDETLQRIVRRTASTTTDVRRPVREVTRRSHRELTEAAKDLLARRLTERIALDDIARELHTSPFHLAHVFRETTGFALHDYRINLRLRSSLELLREPEADLTRIAYDLGFCSLGHFSGSFRAKFGVPPSAVRAQSAQLRKIVEARLAAAS